MANRFKGNQHSLAVSFIVGVSQTAERVGKALKPLLITLGILGVLGVGSIAAWRAAQHSPYFNVRDIELEGTNHLDRKTAIEQVGLDTPTNLFQFDENMARDALLAHPWVAAATVEKDLPKAVRIHFQERNPAGVVVMGALYLVDATGEPFVQPTPKEAAGLPLITGMDRTLYETNPVGARERIRSALSVARLYARMSLAQSHPLSNLHLDVSGRLELILGRTRVVLGQDGFEKKLVQLARIFKQLKKRKMDASYILLSEDTRRAIVMEQSLAQKASGSLSMRPKQ